MQTLYDIVIKCRTVHSHHEHPSYTALQKFLHIKWTFPQLSIMIIYNSTWSILIQ